MKALLVVDIQNDFCPGGALAVPEGDEIVPIINQLKKDFPLVTFTQDWHPKDHVSFASQHPGKKPLDVIDLNGIRQILWPDHCIQGTKGAELHPSLHIDLKKDIIFKKGSDRERDSPSPFYDFTRKKSGFGKLLQEKGVKEVYIVGLATNYCVKYAALDAVQEGFKVHVLLEACRGVDVWPDDVKKAIQEMQQKGVNVV